MAWEKAHIPLSQGQQQKADPRALEAPAMAVSKNVEFDEVGGTQKRKPFSQIPGVCPADIRRLAVHDGALVAFTKAGIYSYDSANGAWTLRADHYAPTILEDEQFVETDDQRSCERAELGDVAVYAWESVADDLVYLAALDVNTGAVIVPPYAQAAGSYRPKLVALASRIFFMYQVSTTNIYIKMLAPGNLDSSTTGEGFGGSAQVTLTAITSFNRSDACKYPAEDDKVVIAYNDGTGTYHVRSYYGEATGAPTAIDAVAPSRDTGSTIAVAAAPNGMVVVVRGNSTDTDVDLLGTDLSDDTVGQTMFSDTTPDYIAAAFREDAESNGSYRCYVFLTNTTDPTTINSSAVNIKYIDDGGNLGSLQQVFYSAAVGSRAFGYGDRVFCWVTFAQQTEVGGMATATGFKATLQNSYLLIRDDGMIVARAMPGRQGGYASAGTLPNPQKVSTSKYVMAGMARRRIVLGDEGSSGYAERYPVGVTVEFDSDEARRSVPFGRTLYIAGGQLMQFDGMHATEVGFHVYPWAFSSAVAAGSSGNLSAGDYVYQMTWRWQNAKGENERSTTATFAKITAGATNTVTFYFTPCDFTLKRADTGTPRDGITNVSVEVWRTAVNPGDGAPFYLASDPDPGNTSNPNPYNESVPLTATYPASGWADTMADSTLTTKEANPDNGSLLSNTSPPAASIVAHGDERIFLAGIPDEPYQICYSRLRIPGEIAAFNEALSVDVPADSGSITALAFANETLVAFCERGIYMLPGDGFDNVGTGENYGPARLLSVDVGAQSQESIAVTPDGVIFRSDKGWYILNRGWTVEYIGGAVSDFDGDTIIAAHVLAKQHQVRIVSNERILVLDTLTKQWSEWDQSGCVGSVIWRGKHVIATEDDEILEQRTDFDEDVSYSRDEETAWIKTDGLSGFGRCRAFHLLGEHRSDCRVRVRVAYDYNVDANGDPVWVDDKYWTSTPAVVGGPLRVRHRLSRQKCTAFKVRITDRHLTIDSEPAPGEAYRLTGMSLEWQPKSGLGRLPATQRQ